MHNQTIAKVLAWIVICVLAFVVVGCIYMTWVMRVGYLWAAFAVIGTIAFVMLIAWAVLTVTASNNTQE